jgi:hypothetical protein
MERAYRGEVSSLLGSGVVGFGITQTQTHASHEDRGQADAGIGRTQ